ncbi:metazoan SpoT homolog-1 [Lycorma delicatula]|uniref:metazoan SpoT homolog-1 n=1 Tax=Lycorma delicatula TaxID=130591 RepID=UPI003F50FD08
MATGKSANFGAKNQAADTLLILRCANFAAVKHKDQRRKNADKTPYINHPIGVANILSEEGGITDPDVICAALLHDTVEDTNTTFEELKTHFGSRITNIVAECTDDKSLPSDERKQLQIVNASGSSHEAKLVKLADKLYNLRDLTNEPPVGWSEEKRANYYVWAQKVIEGLKGTNDALERKLDVIFSEKGLKP